MSNPDVDLKVSHNIICNHCRNNIAEIFQESGEFCLHVGRRELVLMSSDEVSSNRGINERTIEESQVCFCLPLDTYHILLSSIAMYPSQLRMRSPNERMIINK